MLLMLIGMAPLPAEAQTADTVLLASHRNTSGYGRVSSSLSRKIRALDEDPVKELPIPILMGISMRQITPNFGDPRGGGTRTHEGLDIMAPKGAYIVSPTDAVVTGLGTGDYSGKYVYTANPGGERFAYIHLDTIDVKYGQVLKAGDLVGTVGSTGNASGGAPHLHFEIQKDGSTDPYPRLAREFTLKERVAALEAIVKDADDEKDEAESIVSLYRATLISARTQGIALSGTFTKALGTAVGGALPGASLPAGSPSFPRGLGLGSSGEDVKLLQSFLIAQDSGTATDALEAAGATGYLGPVTQKALIEYQTKAGITPASGYFGPLTRARVLAAM